jgi:tetratricopeptide (TPR) repeat protein
MGTRNAIERRLGMLDEHWNTFAESPAVLLRWSCTADDAQMVDGWIGMQHEGAGEVPDFLVRFDLPFDGPERYGFTLRGALERQYDASRDELARAGHPADWRAPDLVPGESDVSALLRCCASFQAYHARLMLTVALVLAPEPAPDADAWQRWLYGLVGAPVPAGVRFLVLDPAEEPRLDALCQAQPERIVSQRLALEMPAAREELARNAAGADPGSQLRVHLVALTSAAGGGDLARAHGAAQQALAIAARQGWPAMQMAVHMALGAAYLGGGHTEHTLAAYRAAQRSALATEQAGDPAGPRLRVQAALAEGAALVSAGRFGEAAPVYEAAAPLASASGDPLLIVEAWRMGGYCHEAAGDPQSAWRCGAAALEAGETLDPAARQASTLPWAGQMMMRLADRWSFPVGADAVRRQMAGLMGPEWNAGPAEAA